MTQDTLRQGTARTAVVTGAAGGVGSHTVRTLASLGWRVVAVVRTSQDAGSLERVTTIYPGQTTRRCSPASTVHSTCPSNPTATSGPRPWPTPSPGWPLGPDAHVTNLDLRPGQEVGAKFNV